MQTKIHTSTHLYSHTTLVRQSFEEIVEWKRDRQSDSKRENTKKKKKKKKNEIHKCKRHCSTQQQQSYIERPPTFCNSIHHTVSKQQ